VHTPEITNLFDDLTNSGIIFPRLVVLNNIKTIYIRRLQLTRNDLYRTFSDNEEHWLSFIQLPNEMDSDKKQCVMTTIGGAVLRIYDYILEQKGEMFKYKYNTLQDGTFCNLVDEAINNLKYDISFELSVADWRRLIHSVKSYLVNLQFGIESPNETQITATFVAYYLKNANGVWSAESIKNYIEASETLELVSIVQDPCGSESIGLEGIDVKGAEELVFYSDGAEDIIDRENLKNLARAVVSSFKSYSDDHRQMEEIFDNEKFVGYESLEEYAEHFQKAIELMQRHSGVIFGAVIALVIGVVGYMLKKKFDARGTKAEETVKEYNEIVKKIESLSGVSVENNYIKYGVVEKSKDIANDFNKAYSTTLHNTLLHGKDGYDLPGLTATMTAHLDAIKECRSDFIEMYSILQNAVLEVGKPSGETCATMISNVQTIFQSKDFDKIQYSRKPLYEYVKGKGGHYPWSSPSNQMLELINLDVERHTSLDESKVERHDFWSARYNVKNDKGAARVIDSLKHPYSYAGPVQPVNHEGLKLGCSLLAQFTPSEMVKLNTLNSSALKLQKQFENEHSGNSTKAMLQHGGGDQVISWPPEYAKNNSPWDSLKPSNKHTSTRKNASEVITAVISGGVLRSRIHAAAQIASSVNDLHKVTVAIAAMTTTAQEYYNCRKNEAAMIYTRIKEEEEAKKK
jgi:hypothetical protein